ncbi:FAD-dependent oxidoreductase [Fuchsiella alkaliacetigena]|uniref:FAD-dependent oxidoreductase n=1 Tax=Fuchsiella alkaliacetigena TaxID=957042 RepID=UPI00200A6BCD|nr:FAD-dependent oxidoreductase [Fuchsiella alkaliacetigena]MCK8823867.1 FAD-dependent oxidoreductase [Fuchsiella alkaliacetigena]
MKSDRYDAIVVGAGPAGSTAALVLAQNNISVLLIERGAEPGSKNMFGGSIYRQPVAKIIPAFWKEAPLERTIVSDELWLMDKNSAVKVGFTGLDFNQEPYNKFSVIRSNFDYWLAQKAVKAGAKLITSTLVTDLVYEKTGLLTEKVDGVKLDNGEIIYGDVVLLAEGANAPLTEKAGLRGKIESSDLFLYVKEEVALPAEVIESRFQLSENEGSNIGMIGYPTAGVSGRGGIWTNKESLSIILGGYLNQINNKGLSPYQLLSNFKAHPLVNRLIAGAETTAYKAHIIPKGGYTNLPQFYDDGVLVAGDAATLVSGRRGLDLAMLSGLYAAETIAQAQAAQDFTSKLLQNYEKKLKNSFFIKDIKNQKGKNQYYKKHPDGDFLISKATNKAAYQFFTVGLEEKKAKFKKIKSNFLNIESDQKLLSDLYSGLKHWRFF